MKHKNISVKSSKISKEDSSNCCQMETDESSQLDEGEEESVNGTDEEEIDLDATATDTDEIESENNSIMEENVIESKNSKTEKIKEKVRLMYEDRQGKQLYLRFPHKVPETKEALEEKVKTLMPLAVKVSKPRQRYARFCLIGFATKEDRDATLKKLKKLIKTDDDFKKYVVNIPRTENAEFINELAERKIKSLENKKSKLLLKKATQKSLKEQNFTSSVVVLNLPKTASILQIRELFSNAVDINIKPGKGKANGEKSVAAITFPTTWDARNAIKKKVSLEGKQLIIKFDNRSLKKKRKRGNPGTFSKRVKLESVPSG